MHRSNTKLVWPLILTTAAALLTGCVSHRPAPATHGTLIDERVTSERVENTLTQNSEFDFSHVRVRTVNHKVFLSGTVASDAAKSRAEELTHALPRVESIVNEIQVTDHPVDLSNPAKSPAEKNR